MDPKGPFSLEAVSVRQSIRAMTITAYIGALKAHKLDESFPATTFDACVAPF